MKKARAKRRQITAAERGRIVQRVLVDRWSIEQTAATFGIGERLVTDWVAAYRRHGMASLRDTAAVDRAPHRWLWLLRLMGSRLASRWRGRMDATPTRAISFLGRDHEAAGQPDTGDRRTRRN